MILTHKSDDDSEDLTGSIDDDRLIFRILGDESHTSCGFLEAFQGDGTIQRSDDDIMMLCLECTIDDDDISSTYPGSFHTVSLHSDEIARDRMFDEIGGYIDIFSSSRFGGEGESCRNRFVKDHRSIEKVYKIYKYIYFLQYYFLEKT